MVQGSLVARYTKAGLAPHVAILQEYRDDAKVGEGGEGPWEGTGCTLESRSVPGSTATQATSTASGSRTSETR